MVHYMIKLMAHLTNPPILEFREVFVKDCMMLYSDISLILQCKNIDFGHVSWPHYMYKQYYDNKQLMFHIIDNILDINTKDHNLEHGLVLLSKICTEDIWSNPNNNDIVKYAMNNGCLNNFTFVNFNATHQRRISKYHSIVRFGKLVGYLTIISFDRFKGYYNLEKYYYIIHTMLLIMKAQQRLSAKGQLNYSLPNTVIKHLIIPFIYQ